MDRRPSDKRKGVATGKGRGGARPGAGRPVGSTSALPAGTVRALLAGAAARKRLEGSAPDAEASAVLEHVYGRISDVLDGDVSYLNAPSVLKAAGMVAEAIAGKVAEKVDHRHEGKITFEQIILASLKPPAGEGGAEG